MVSKTNPIESVSIQLAILIINFPIVNYLAKLYNKDCGCSNIWKLKYLYFYQLFWYATTGLQIIILFLFPKLNDWFSESILYYPAIVVSSISYMVYLMILWSYVEYLKEIKCHCSDIREHQYVSTYAWFFFICYIILSSYIGITMLGLKPK